MSGRPGIGRSRCGGSGFTLIEVLIALALIGILATLSISLYTGFIQRAREAAIIQYLREVHKGQQEWRLETDDPGYTGDFDELEETGFIPDTANYTRVRRRVGRRTGRETETSSRVYQAYQLDLRAVSTPSTDTYTYSVTAYPQSRDRSVRWFYIDQSGAIRAATGWAGPGAPRI